MVAVVNTIAEWPGTADALRRILQIDPSYPMTCHGKEARSDNRCGNKLSKLTARAISNLLLDIVGKGSFLAAKVLLENLAFQTLCVGVHQKLASKIDELMKKWEATLSDLKCTVVKNEPVCDGAAATTKEITQDSTRIIARGAPITTPAGSVKTEVKTEYIKVEEVDLMDIENKISEPATSPEKPKRQRRKSKKPEPEKPKHTFVPYNRAVKGVADRNAALKKLLEKELTSTELREWRKSKKGCIYLYTFPDSYRDASPHIKIGHSTDLDKRMVRWSKKCGYDPKVLGHFDTEYYRKVESLVHADLMSQRLKELDCPTCHKKHIEWFDIKLPKAVASVGLWLEWARRRPYDDEGMLKPEWKERLRDVDVLDADCWESFVNDFKENDDSGYGGSEDEEEFDYTDSEEEDEE